MQTNDFEAAHSSSLRSRGVLLATSLVALFAVSCKQTPAEEPAAPRPTSAHVTEDITVEATVQAVDRDTRLVTLRNEAGESVVVLAGPAVANFDQIEVGDFLRVRYQASMAVALKPPGEAVQPASGSVAAAAAPIGAKPGVAVEEHITATVRIESVDTEQNIVVLTPPGGGLRAVHVLREEGREFIKGLKPGDLVDMTYTEALAVAIEKP